MTTSSVQSVTVLGTGDVVARLIDAINANRVYLSEVDSAIGDGDHGINMSKGFTNARARIAGRGVQDDLAASLEEVGLTLVEGIGGSMGPLYGGFFLALSETIEGHAELNAKLFGDALGAAVAAVRDVGGANVGDKCLVDTLAPALDAYRDALASGVPFAVCLDAMAEAARRGRDSTRDLQARIGRASRLGPRSIGVLDAGATSACLILESLAEGLKMHLSTNS